MTRRYSVLKIDVDAGHTLLTLNQLTGLLRRAGKRPVWLMQERSRSGKGWHLWFKVAPACRSLMEVVALQAVLGSDPYREANNVCRVLALDNMTPTERSYWASRLNVFYDPVY